MFHYSIVCPSLQTGPGCAQCIIGYYENPYGHNDSACLSCDCNIQGSDSIKCDSNGMCMCKEHVTGNICEGCTTGYFPFPGCNVGKFLHRLNK